MLLLFNLCDASSVATEYLHKTEKLFKKISLLTNNYSTNIAPLLTEIILTRQFICYVSWYGSLLKIKLILIPDVVYHVVSPTQTA